MSQLEQAELCPRKMKKMYREGHILLSFQEITEDSTAEAIISAGGRRFIRQCLSLANQHIPMEKYFFIRFMAVSFIQNNFNKKGRLRFV